MDNNVDMTVDTDGHINIEMEIETEILLIFQNSAWSSTQTLDFLASFLLSSYCLTLSDLFQTQL